MNFSIELLFFDYIVLTLTLIFILFGIWKGFISSVLSLLTWVGSVFITIYSYEYLSVYLNNILLNIDFFSRFEEFTTILTSVLTIPIIFLLSLFILKRIRKIISKDLDKQVLGLIFDKFFGIAYGIIFSYVFLSTILYLTNNNNIDLLYNLNIFFNENSNILKLISEYNENFFQYYNNSNMNQL